MDGDTERAPEEVTDNGDTEHTVPEVETNHEQAPAEEEGDRPVIELFVKVG